MQVWLCVWAKRHLTVSVRYKKKDVLTLFNKKPPYKGGADLIDPIRIRLTVIHFILL